VELELTLCPECGRPAEVFDRFVVFGQRGPIEHVMVRCITGRSFERRVGRWNSARGWKPVAELYPDADSDI
jgi:hypothetical protein